MEAKVLRMLVPMALEGLKVTMGVFAVTLIMSLPLAIVVAKLRMSKNKIVSKITGTYIYIMRGTPLLLQLMFIFFGFYRVPYIGYPFSREQAIVIAFVLNYTAYFAEIFRGGIESIPKGQYEAAAALSFTKPQTFFRIILPQVIKRVVPASSNEIITLIKDTSLANVVAYAEITLKAKQQMQNYSSLTPLFIAGAFYFVLAMILTVITAVIEKKLHYYK